MSTNIDITREPLPGYRLIERLGAGGYGEVWRVEAPGGLTKAIKFVFGQHHEKRASNEMRALERVRGVRHPFLLSLERIEVIEGRLVVVTELADGSVKDRFDACRRQGLPGIPREELIGYLRDSADALDFMSNAHALQHLDIKPENLLILAGHVKVADFGLVQDVRQSGASLMGGMTPLYAAPEVFRGTPSAHSDQYSLAILYQEMLTGALPFVGSNAAELTMQHLNEEPDLAALSGLDRYAVSRALSKEPGHRYASCREFVEALVQATSAGNVGFGESSAPKSAEAAHGFVERTTREGPATELFDEDETTGWNAEPELLEIDFPASEARIVDLPPLDLSPADAVPVPTLFLGVGGTAGQVLAQLRSQIHERFGASGGLPAFQFLLLDTDSKALADVARRGGAEFLPDETFSLPLGRPQHYREQSQQLLRWLSRRWLYNIPRSLRTDGLRPLGRLALADHARQVVQRIRRAIGQALDAEAVEVTSQTIDRALRPGAMQVYVVASISGGTGGGMAIDLAYAVRAILGRLGLAESRVTGLMIHSTGGDPRHTELARVNAFSWLTEYRHFCQPGSFYPGDPSCGLPAHEPGVRPFDDTYLLHLGENLAGAEFEAASQGVAHYLHLDALTPAKAFFTANRKAVSAAHDADGTSENIDLRSFGIYRRSAASHEFCDEFANAVAVGVLQTWQATADAADIGDERDPCYQAAQSGAEHLIHRLQLPVTGMAANARTLLEATAGGNGSEFLASWLSQGSQAQPLSEAAQLEAVDRTFDGTETSGAAGVKFYFLGQYLADIMAPLEEKLREEVRRWVVGRIDDPQARLAGARTAIRILQYHFQAAEAETKQLGRIVFDKLAEIRQVIGSGGSGLMIGSRASRWRSERVAQYFWLRLDQLSLAATKHICRAMLADLKVAGDELVAFGRELEQILAVMTRTAGSEAGGSTLPGEEESQQAGLMAKLSARMSTLVADVDRRLQKEFLSQQGGLLKTVMKGGRPRAQLSAKLQELSARAVRAAVTDANVAQGEDAGDYESLQSGLVAATPSLLQYGGARRVLALLPRAGVDARAISEATAAGVATVASDDNSLTFCVEASGLSLLHAAVNFIQFRRDRADFAGRVHSRSDIDWQPLIPTAGDATPAEGDEPFLGSVLKSPLPNDPILNRTMVL